MASDNFYLAPKQRILAPPNSAAKYTTGLSPSAIAERDPDKFEEHYTA
jgi:hypothetical protein